METRTLRLIPAALLAACFSCATGGGANFATGQRAEAKGDFSKARQEYVVAINRDPRNAVYRSALERVDGELLQRLPQDAKAREKAGDWSGASEAWTQAAEIRPDNEDFRVRAELSAEKGKDLDPAQWLAAVAKVYERHPDHRITKRTFSAAKDRAYKFHVDRAEENLSASRPQQGLEHFEKARAIKGAMPGVPPGRFATAQALALFADGEKLEREGDLTGAYEKYQAAYARKNLNSIAGRLATVKRQAQKIEALNLSARAAASKGRYAQAVRDYEKLVELQPGSKGAAAELQSARKSAITAACQTVEARAFNRRRIIAQRALEKALRYAQVSGDTQDLVLEGFEDMQRGRPGRGRTKIERAGLKNTIISATLQRVTLEKARKNLATAQRLAKKKPADAAEIVLDLRPFEKELPAVKDFDRSVKLSAFVKKLDLAFASARKGDDRQAARHLRDALSSSNAPAKLAKLAGAGCDSLAAGAFVEAELAFREAKATAPKSRLANWGVDIAQYRREQTERAALAVLKNPKAKTAARAAAAGQIAGSRRLNPPSPSVKKAIDILSKRAASEDRGTASEFTATLAQLTLLSNATRRTKLMISKGIAALDGSRYSEAQKQFDLVLAKSPSDPAARAGRAFAARRLGAKQQGRQADQLVAEGDALMKAGKSIDAYQKFSAAYELRKSKAIAKRMAAAKSQSAKTVAALEAARKASKRGRHDQAMKAYARLAKMPGAPDTSAEQSEVRDAWVRVLTKQAEGLAEKSKIKKATQRLARAAQVMQLSAKSAKAISEGLSKIERGTPGTGLGQIESAGLAADAPLLRGSQVVATAVAANIASRAKKLATRNPKKATAMIAGLRRFEGDVPEIAALNRRLLASAYDSKLEGAFQDIKAGRLDQGLGVYRKILAKSKASGGLRQNLERGVSAFAKSDFVGAEMAFVAAQRVRKDSRLAGWGIDAARWSRRRAERSALAALKKKGGDAQAAVGVLLASARIEPNSTSLSRARSTLLSRARNPGLADAELARLLDLARQLSPLKGAQDKLTQSAIASISRGAHAEARAQFENVLQTAKTSEVAKVGRDLARSRQRAAIASGEFDPKRADAATARILGDLLAKAPDDPKLVRALARLTRGARSAAELGNSKEASRLLGLAIVARAPKEPLGPALTRANAALASQRFDEAEQKFGAALEIDPTSDLARDAFELSQQARLAAVMRRVLSLMEKRNSSGLRALLDQPSSPTGSGRKKIFDAVLKQASRVSSSGDDARAAKLLRAANIKTEEKASREATAKANTLLARSKYKQAESAYRAIVKKDANARVAEAGADIAFTQQVAAMLSSVAELKKVGDLDRGAKAAAELFSIDPRDSDARAAVRAALSHAEKSASAGDSKEVLRVLEALAVASTMPTRMRGALGLVRQNKFVEAASSFGRLKRKLEKEKEEDRDAEVHAAIQVSGGAERVCRKLAK